MELEDLLGSVDGIGFLLFAQMLTLGGEFLELEVREGVGLLDLVDDDVGGVVAELTGADFQLLDVAQVFVFGGLADGKDTVKEIVELLGTGQVVLGDGAGEAALGCVGDDEDGPAVLLFELHEFHHEEARVHAFVAAVAQVGQVVDDQDVAVELEGGFLDVGQDAVFVVFEVEPHGIDLGAEEAVGETEEAAGDVVGVAQLELFLGELAVEVEDAVVTGNLVGDLDRVDTLSQVGIGKEAADLALVPELLEQGHRVGLLGGVEEGVVGRLDGDHADGVGVGGLVDFGLDGPDGIAVITHRGGF